MTTAEEPEERMENDDYAYEANEEEPKNKFPDLCSKINCDEFAKVSDPSKSPDHHSDHPSPNPNLDSFLSE